MEQKSFMAEAIKEAYAGIENHHGGPFGSVVVKNGTIVGRGHNRVIIKNDPTCHGEIEAIRDACRRLGTHDLTGCELYTTAEPCPMCLGAVLWANIKAIYYGCNRMDTEKIGFRDNAFYDFMEKKNSPLAVRETNREECLALFDAYQKDEREPY